MRIYLYRRKYNFEGNFDTMNTLFASHFVRNCQKHDIMYSQQWNESKSRLREPVFVVVPAHVVRSKLRDDDANYIDKYHKIDLQK